MGKDDAMWMKIRAVEWGDYKTAQGKATSIPAMLNHLASRKSERAMRASHQLWSALCGSSKVHSATIPTIPLLLEIYNISEAPVQDGILDILTICKHTKVTEPWAVELERVNALAQKVMGKRRPSRDEIVAAKMADFLA